MFLPLIASASKLILALWRCFHSQQAGVLCQRSSVLTSRWGCASTQTFETVTPMQAAGRRGAGSGHSGDPHSPARTCHGTQRAFQSAFCDPGDRLQSQLASSSGPEFQPSLGLAAVGVGDRCAAAWAARRRRQHQARIGCCSCCIAPGKQDRIGRATCSFAQAWQPQFRGSAESRPPASSPQQKHQAAPDRTALTPRRWCTWQ